VTIFIARFLSTHPCPPRRGGKLDRTAVSQQAKRYTEAWTGTSFYDVQNILSAYHSNVSTKPQQSRRGYRYHYLKTFSSDLSNLTGHTGSGPPDTPSPSRPWG